MKLNICIKDVIKTNIYYNIFFKILTLFFFILKFFFQNYIFKVYLFYLFVHFHIFYYYIRVCFGYIKKKNLMNFIF